MIGSIAILLGIVAGIGGDDPSPRTSVPVRVVATLPVYASIAQELGGAEVTVTSIADPREDAHFVRPKPSFALELRRADLFITTGLDLELWVPTLLDRAGNRKVMEGAPGYVTAYTGVTLLDIPVAADRSAGDIHLYGNPHIFTDPLNAIIIARNITTGLKRVAPDRASHWDQGLVRFTDRIHRRLFGDRLVEVAGGQALANLARQGRLFAFLADTRLEGAPLMQQLGGWLAAAAPFRGTDVVCYHKDWSYFEDRFDLDCIAFVEAKPGIPPTPGHVAELISTMRTQNIRVLIAAEHFGRERADNVARRAGAVPVLVPMAPGTVAGVTTYFDLVDHWVESIAAAFRQ